MNHTNIYKWGVIVALAAIVAVPSAPAVSYSFKAITANSVADVAAGQSQLSVEVTAGGNGQVLFQFHNVGTAAMSICDIYFDDGTLLGIASILNGAGTSFSLGANPRELPGGNAVNFHTSTGNFSADSDPAVQPNGVGSGESLDIFFNLINGKTLADTIAALELSLANPGKDMDNGLRIGIHVQGFADGKSESFVNGPPPSVPDGGSTLALIGLSFASLGLLRRRLA